MFIKNKYKHAKQYINIIQSNPSNPMPNENELRKFQCANCRKSKLVLKKVANQQHHGFACEECWAAIETRPRYGLGMGKCSMQ